MKMLDNASSAMAMWTVASCPCDDVNVNGESHLASGWFRF